jgi:hypothetical protein
MGERSTSLPPQTSQHPQPETDQFKDKQRMIFNRFILKNEFATD